MALTALFLGRKVKMFVLKETGVSADNHVQVMSDGAADLYSKNMILVRMDDHEIISEYASQALIYPASMTKIMTAVLAIEAADDLNEAVYVPETIFPALEAANASVAGFKPGEKVSVLDLIYGTLLPSGADAAGTLAIYTSGSEEAFVELMNKKALSLGMLNTHFDNVTGLHTDTHVTTLQDMALLLEYALDLPVFRFVFSSREYRTLPTNKHGDGLYMTSTVLSKTEDDTIIGGKSGYTPEAGLCLASLANVSGREYMMITAGACGDTQSLPYHVIDAQQVFKLLE